jgi:glycosyltransferase involved in cell wall biosynthesis
MDTKYDKMEEEKQKVILEYITLCNKEESQSKIKLEKYEKPKISIIIPIYNGENNIIPMMNSIKNQTLQEIEIICINDNSSDKTSSILEKLQKEDPRITILKNKLQRGVLYNYIDGSMQAKGEYVAFLNVNDYFTSKDILNNVYEIATKKFEEKIDIVHYQICGSIYDKENKNIESLNHYHTVNLNNINKIMKKPYIEENYFQKNRDITESRFAFDKIYKKELIQKIADYIGPQIWNQKLSYAYEFLFAFSSMKQCDTFVTINDIGYCHKIKDESKMWEIDGDRLKYNESGNKDIGDYMLVLERIIQLTEKDKECGEFRENILKELTTEHYLKAIARSIFYDKFLTLYEKIYNWKFGDKETKKRAKENIKNIISYKIESKKKFVDLLGV